MPDRTYETSHAYEVVSGGPFELLLFSLPRALLQERADVVCGRTAVRLDGRAGPAALAGPFLRGLADRMEDGDLDADTPGLTECVVDLVRMLYADGPPAGGDGGTEGLFTRVTAYAELHLGDPRLGPLSLAAAHFVSPRLLHRVFEQRGHTVAGWIRARRLDAVRRDLADPALRERPIRLLAAAWGFPDAPHFSRLFHREEGCTPGEYRAAALRSAQ